MAEAATTTRPNRSRARTAPAKAAPATAAVDEAPAEAAPVKAANKTQLELEHVGDTKSYSKWQPPAGTGCAGNFYAPLGVTTVKVLVVS